MAGNVKVEGAKKLKLNVKTTKYTRTNQTSKVKKKQTIQVKNLTSKQKVSWKSSNKKLAAVKAGKKGKAKLTVSLGKAGTARITATVKNKKTNKKVKVLKQKITVVNRAVPTKPPVTPPSKETPTPTPKETPTPTIDPHYWVGTWGSSQYQANPTDIRRPGLKDATVRQIVRVSLGGEQIRLTYSNQFGKSDLEIKAATVANPTMDKFPNIKTSTLKTVTFRGSESITIPAGGKAVSDVIEYPVNAVDKIAVSTYFGEVPSEVTHHGAARAYSYQQLGNQVRNITMGQEVRPTSWYFLSNVDVVANPSNKSIVCFGDSITDGYGTDTSPNGPDSYLRWTDILANNLPSDEATKGLSVINMGIGANSIFGGQGPPAKDRFDRDVIEQVNAGYLVLQIGVNDVGYAGSLNDVTRITGEYQIMIDKAHAKGIKVFVGTLSPFHGNGYYTELHEEVRQGVNAWLRDKYEKGGVEGLLDFDQLLLRPDSNPPALAGAYNNDGLHPNAAGYKAMGELAFDTIAEYIKENPVTE